MAAPAGLLNLVKRFEHGRTAYLSGFYKEAHVRQEFIDPLFRELGWDMENAWGATEPYKEVVHEDAIKVGRAHKAPDYGFRIGGRRRFFVEAKKPYVKLAESKDSAFQLRRYAWSAKLPVSILTDFQEFVIYDCRVRPDQSDKPEVALFRYHRFEEYPEKWDQIYSLFSREAVVGGSLDQFAEVETIPRGSATVDSAFLKEIESWRLALARNLVERNPSLTQRQLNFAVQMTIDRIIFLRMVEDRGIEDYGRLEDLLQGCDLYLRLREFYRRADERYNSGLFHFTEERGRPEPPDDLTPSLAIDDDVLRCIIRSIYFPHSPYEFSVLPADILGQVYEQFLGRVIRLGTGDELTVEEKPEVRKAGGVYYTPTFVVQHIVEQTLGPLLEGKKPGPRGGASRIRIVDPACGSGSFLIGAYQFLLDWHRDQYVNDGADKHRNVLYQGPGGQWLLTTPEKRRILVNSIFGVDIDPQAVEVTKLSLLLKVLEGETAQSLVTQLRMFHERALPDLEGNIKCGNSLIGPDFFGIRQIRLFDEEENFRINVFDWNAAFPHVMQDGGFDAVIGNPPYLNIDETWGKGDERQRYLKRAYSFIYNDKTDILFYFLAKAVQIGKGEIGFIVSRAFLEAYKADKLRRWLAEQTDVREITDFRNFYVFDRVGITTAIVSLTKGRSIRSADVYQLEDRGFRPDVLGRQKQKPSVFRRISVDQSLFGSDRWVFAAADAERVIRRIDAVGHRLSDVLFVGKGMETGRNDVFGKLSRNQVEDWGLEAGTYYVRARNSDIHRYQIKDSGEMLLYVEDFASFEELPTGVQDHLRRHEDQLKGRAAYQRGNCDWWRYTWPLHRDHIHKPKLLCPYLATSNRFAIDDQARFLGLTDTTVIYDNGQPEHLCYILGLLNSRLLTFRFRFIGKLKGGGVIEYFWNSISQLSIKRVDFSDACERRRHDDLVLLVQHMINLKTRLSVARVAHERTILQRRIDALDQQIDGLVYELYRLTEDEIAVVEASFGR